MSTEATRRYTLCPKLYQFSVPVPNLPVYPLILCFHNIRPYYYFKGALVIGYEHWGYVHIHLRPPTLPIYCTCTSNRIWAMRLRADTPHAPKLYLFTVPIATPPSYLSILCFHDIRAYCYFKRVLAHANKHWGHAQMYLKPPTLPIFSTYPHTTYLTVIPLFHIIV